MRMRYLTADIVFPVSSEPIKNGVVVLNDKGWVVSVTGYDPVTYEAFELEYYKGAICPGFVNAHCHLELSHLKGRIPEKTGLPEFLRQVVQLRDVKEEDILAAIDREDQFMLENGIVAVGDISNTNYTFARKKESPIDYYTFIEAFDFLPDNAEKEWNKALSLSEKLGNEAKHAIVPHAPYSVSEKLFKYIGDLCYETDGVVSLHNQETPSENEMFQNKSGELLEVFQSFGIDYSNWKPSGFNSMSSVVVHLPKCVKILLVHNTCSTREDIKWAHAYSKMVYWCFCPNANLYIEDKLPNIPMFIEEGCKCVLGTDSLSSNHQLSILEEMKTISDNFPQIPFITQLDWATKNGAELLGFQKTLGSIEAGKRPGINLIEDFDLEKMCLGKNAQVKKLA